MPFQPVLVILQDDETGDYNVQGPLENRKECYGLLKIAEEAISDFNREKRKAKDMRIVPPPSGLVLPKL